MDRKQPSPDEKNLNQNNKVDLKESFKQQEASQKKKQTLILSNEQALQNFIDRIDYEKYKDQVIKARNLMVKVPIVGHLLYLYLKEQGQGEILENENFSKLEFSTRKLAETALEHNLYIIARIGLNGKNLKSSDKDLLKTALRSNSTGSIKLISKMLLGGGPLLMPLEQIFILEINEQIVQLVKNKHDKAAKNPETFVHGIYFLQFFSIVKLTDQYMLKIVDILEDYLDNKILIFSRAISPLSTASVLCDFVDNLVPRFKRYFNRLNALRDRLKQIGITFMEEIQDALALEITYFKQILPAKNNLIEIYLNKQELFQEFLSYGLASEFMLKKFNGKYKSDYNFMVASSTLKTLKGQNTQPVVKAESSKVTQIYQSKGPKNFFGYIFTNLEEVEGVHNWFQYGIWKSSSLFRLIINIILYVIILLIIVYFSLNFFEDMRKIHNNVSEELLNVQNDIQVYQNDPVSSNLNENLINHIKNYLEEEYGTTIYSSWTSEQLDNKINEFSEDLVTMDIWDAIKLLDQDYIEEVEEMQLDEQNLENDLQIVKYAPIFYFLCFVQTIFEVINHKKIIRQVEINLLHFLDFILCGLATYFFIRFEQKIDQSEVPILEKIDILDSLEKIWAIVLFLTWLKFLLYLKMTKQFGIIIRIIELSLIDIINFLIILLIMMMAFVTIFFILFEDSNDDFKNLFTSLRTSASMILGNFSLENFYDEENLGVILILIYMIITNILALNLLIAILSTTYEVIKEQSCVQYTQILYNYNKFTKSTKRNTGLVCAPSPINIISLPFQIANLVTNSIYIDQLCLKTIYLVELILFFYPLYLIFNIILSPFVYFYHFINIFKFNNTMKAYIKSSLWMILGFPYVIIVILTYDSYIFFRICYLDVYVKESLEKIDFLTVQKISLFSKKNIKHVFSLEEAMEKIHFLKVSKVTNNPSDKILQIDQKQEYIKDQQNSQLRQQSPNAASFMYNNQSEEIQILETEFDDEMEQELYMNIVLKGKSILQKFADHEGKIDFQLVDAVLTHCKFHKISLQFGILHCYNYQEIEQSLLKIIKQQEEEKQTEEQWNLLKKQRVTLK